MNESDTPRTDEAIEAMGLEAYVVPVEVCRQLELELNASLENQLESQAEIARLREQAKLWHQHYRDKASNAQKYKWAFIEM